MTKQRPTHRPSRSLSDLSRDLDRAMHAMRDFHADDHGWAGRVRHWMRCAWREVVYALMVTLRPTIILTINVLAFYAVWYLAFGR